MVSVVCNAVKIIGAILKINSLSPDSPWLETTSASASANWYCFTAVDATSYFKVDLSESDLLKPDENVWSKITNQKLMTQTKIARVPRGVIE
jgi:hypothetical protein